MENRKSLKFLIPILVLGFFIAPQNVSAYGVETHAFLTSKTIDFYNQHFKIKVSIDLGPYLIDGARREDNMPRYLNHFYDPVNDRGLDDSSYSGYKSKEWAQNEKLQNRLTYKLFPSTVASILSASQIEKIDPIFDKTNFTWKKAIELYAKGEKEQALFALGHVVHLIQDSAVPDHTRNDSHPPFDNGGSPYENWTHQFSSDNPDKDLASRLKNKNPILLSSLSIYFNETANYSNNNFYSKDSIKNYELPEPDYFEVGSDGENYGVRKDSEFGDYYLIIGSDSLDWSDQNILIFKGERIIKSYWHRLSVKSVQYGAGVIDLFFKEVEKAKNDPSFVIEEPKSILAQVIDTVKGFFGGLFGDGADDLVLVAEIDLNSGDELDDNQVRDEVGSGDIEEIDQLEESIESQVNRVEDAVEESSSTADDELVEIPIEIIQLELESVEPIEVPNAALPVLEQQPSIICSFANTQSPTRQKLIINEVAWAGTLNSTNDEWIELKNISGTELDISGWQVLDKAEQIKVIVPDGIKLPTNGFYLLERTDDSSVPDVEANQIYKGALSNSNEGLRLFNNQCNLIDEVFANSSWPAGDNGAKRTMERSPDLGWHTYSGNGENNIFGTPKKENSLRIISQSGGATPNNNQASTEEQATEEEQEAEMVESQVPKKLLISEVQISGETSKDEFIELYNPNNESVDLTDWVIKRKSSSGIEYSLVSASRLEGKTIPAQGYFLLAHEDYTGTVTSDVVWAKSNSVASNNSVLLYAFDGSVIDKVGIGVASDFETSPYPNNPDNNQSISRDAEIDTDNNAADFILSKPTPKNSDTSGGFLKPDPWEELVVIESEPQSTDHLVISEIFINMEGADNQEFIELYNPTEQPISLADWSLQYLSGSASSTEKIKKKNFINAAVVQPKSFYLVGTGGYDGEQVADMTWSQSLNNIGATVFLVSSTSPIINVDDASVVDRIAYGEGSGLLLPETEIVALSLVGQSLERRVWQNGICFSAQKTGEFLGNGCDSENNAEDFESRSLPNPQNSQNLSEPRLAPTAVQNFNISYELDDLKLKFSWQPSLDANGATSTVTYRLFDTSFASSTLLAETAYLQSEKKIIEIGRDYHFKIITIDRDGLTSSSTSASINVSSFLDSLTFYQASSTPYQLDLFWSDYPFIPVNLKSITSDQIVFPSWHTVIFYYNQEAKITGDLTWFYNPPEGSWGLVMPGGLKVKYPNCFGGDFKTIGTALILPDTSDNCSALAGNHASLALNWDQLEDDHLLLEVITDNFATSTSLGQASSTPVAGEDYVTAAFYAYQPGYEPNNYGLGLVAVDKTKYYFQTDLPVSQPPTAPNEVGFEFDEEFFMLKMQWEKSTDVDTLDNLISYKVNYGSTIIATLNNFIEILVEPGAIYNFEFWSKDDFGNFSSSTLAIYEVPDAPLPYDLIGVSWGNLENASSTILSLEFEEYPFMDSETSSAMVFFLNQLPLPNYSFENDEHGNSFSIAGGNSLRLSYLPCDFGFWTEIITSGGLFFKNTDCPSRSLSTLFSDLLAVKIAEEDTQLTVEVVGEFSENDFITIGFYELSEKDNQGKTYYQNTTNYNKKIYFQP